LPLFKISNANDVVYKWLYHLKKRVIIIEYVIMTNHVHALTGFSNTGKTLLLLYQMGNFLLPIIYVLNFVERFVS
jgi:hypothetical protein